MLGAFFMATDYVTNPITDKGKIIYAAVLLGLLTGLFRFFGESAEGVSFAIIIGNLFVPLIEMVTIQRHLERRAKGMSSEKKERSFVVDTVILCLITLILGGILAGVYTVTKKPIENAQAKTDNEACEVVLKAVEKVAAGMELKVADDAEDAAEKANKFLQEHVIDKSSSEGKVEREESGDSYSKHVVVSTVKKRFRRMARMWVMSISRMRKKGYGGSISAS